jgi:hypothetical protein
MARPGKPVIASARMWQYRPMSTVPLEWNEQFAGRLVTAKSGNVTYYIDSGHGLGVAAYVGVRLPPRGSRGFSLGSFHTIDDAKRKCEQHYADGSDVSAASGVVRSQ